MKIINEKGKLFGIINIIDLSILLIVALILIGGLSRMKSSPIISNEDTPGIITFEVSNIRMVNVDNINIGDPIYHYDKGGYLGEIIEVSHEPFKEPVEYDGQWIDAEVPGKYVVKFKVKSELKDSPDIVLAGGEQIRIGAQFRLKNKKVAFFGTVMGVEVSE